MEAAEAIMDDHISVVKATGRSNWIERRKLKCSIYCLRDVLLKIKRDLSNSIQTCAEKRDCFAKH